MKKLITIFLYLIFLIILTLVSIFLLSFHDYYYFFKTNYIRYPMVMMAIISLTSVLHLYLKGKNLFLIFLINVGIFMNIFIAYNSDNYFFIFFKWTFTLYFVFFLNSIFITILSVYYLLINIKNKSLLDFLYRIILLAYAIYYLLWSISLFFGMPNLLDFIVSPLPYNSFLYYLVSFLRRDGIIYFSLIISVIFFNNNLFYKQKKFKRYNKIIAVLVWLIVGIFGLERLYVKTKYHLVNFQIVTTLLLYLLSIYLHFFLTAHYLFMILLILLLLFKIIGLFYSLYDIFKEEKHEQNT